MKVQLTRDLALPLAKEGKKFWVLAISADGDDRTVYLVNYYGNTVGFPADACEEVAEET